MNIQTAELILFNNGYSVTYHPAGGALVVTNTIFSDTNKISALLQPYDPNFVTIINNGYGAHTIYFD